TVEMEVVVGIGSVEPDVVSRVEDRPEEFESETEFHALVYCAVGIHHCAGTPGRCSQTLQFVLDVGTVKRNIPGAARPRAACADLVGGARLRFEIRAGWRREAVRIEGGHFGASRNVREHLPAGVDVPEHADPRAEVVVTATAGLVAIGLEAILAVAH